MRDMDCGGETTELRRGVLDPCVLALLAERPRFGLELVRDLSHADGLLTSEGTVYPLLNRLRDSRWVTSRWRHEDDQRPRRYYSITDQGRDHLTAFRAEWSAFATAVDTVLRVDPGQPRTRHRGRQTAGKHHENSTGAPR
jgi:PadR family transcriptional regulator, regulatory protein PadR